MLEELSKCERVVQLEREAARLDQELAQKDQQLAQIDQEQAQNDQRLAQNDQRLAQIDQEICASNLGIVTSLTAMTSNYDVEQRSEIEKSAHSFETCGQPRVGGAIRAAMLDQEYDRAGTLAAAACDIGQTSGCHFGALISAYGNNPHMAPGEGLRRMKGLCDDGFALSCRVIEIWADR